MNQLRQTSVKQELDILANTRGTVIPKRFSTLGVAFASKKEAINYVKRTTNNEFTTITKQLPNGWFEWSTVKMTVSDGIRIFDVY